MGMYENQYLCGCDESWYAVEYAIPIISPCGAVKGRRPNLYQPGAAPQVGVFTGKMGQKVASEIFTMVDDGSIPNARGTTDFDDEGTP